MIPERLKGVYNLALNGVDGEKDAAKKILDKLLQRYNLSIEDIGEEQPEIFAFTYHGKWQKNLLIQVAYKVLDCQPSFYNVRAGNSKRISPSQVGIKCTKYQRTEIMFLHDFYCQLWESEIDKLMLAFIYKHELWGTGEVDASNKSKSPSIEEMMKIQSMIDGLDSKSPLKQLPGGSNR